MSDDGLGSFWTALNPTSWPLSPHYMSFSTLVELEACPRRWALKRASYIGVLDTPGYPARPSLPAIEGEVVHRSLQAIVSALARSGAPSLFDEKAISTLRALGGFTAVVQHGIELTLSPYEGNARAGPVLDRVRARLNDRVSQLRATVQKQVARIAPAARAGGGTGTLSRAAGQARHRLLRGAHSEVILQASDMEWHGVADLITISEKRCEIRDFKTGVPREGDEIQLRIYALLWAKDRELNPESQLVTRLVLSYGNTDVDVLVPDEEQQRHIEEDLRQRTDIALAHLGSDPPEARPNSENCAHCSVRQLCGEYWTWCKRADSTYESSREFGDAQVRLTDRHGPRSWDGVVESGQGLRIGGRLLLRTSDVPFELRAGQRLRVLNAHKSAADDEIVGSQQSDPPVVMTMSANSEIYLVP